jgi:hypothetical protein
MVKTLAPWQGGGDAWIKTGVGLLCGRIYMRKIGILPAILLNS